MPFARASQELRHFRRVAGSRQVAERLTEATGAAYRAVQAAETQRIERELPASPPGPDKQFLSVDGAMVSLVGGEWVEDKTLVLGEVQPTHLKSSGVHWARAHVNSMLALRNAVCNDR